MSRGKGAEDTLTDSERVEDVISELPQIHTPPTPVVRVSLDRLDALIDLSNELVAKLDPSTAINDGFDLAGLQAVQRQLALEMHYGLQQIRMVRFGVLEMRLNRAVNVTCVDENKSADVVIETPDVEIDTLVIDALIEPLLHLLKNAVVHGIESPETRRLLGKPEKGLIRIHLVSNGETIKLSISDDGRGISTAKLIDRALAAGVIDVPAASAISEEDACRLIFERGLTTAESLNMNAGRGVGMCIVKDSVEARGGSIAVESEQHQGTKFILRFPIFLAPERKKVQPLVLVVDDSETIRRVTVKMVEEKGLRAVPAINGSDAIEILQSGMCQPNLILSDVEMPVMDGWELLRYLNRDKRFADVPRVMITSLDSDEYRARAYELGASDYLIKPFEIDDLERLLSGIEPSVPVGG